MIAFQETLLQCSAQTVQPLLEKLAALTSRVKAGADETVPLVTLHVAGGHAISGWIMRLDNDPKYGEGLLVHASGGRPDQPGLDAVYLSSQSVVAVYIHGANTIAHVLSNNAVPPPPSTQPVPSKLEIQRSADASSKELSTAIGSTLAWEIQWDGLADAPESMRALQHLLTDGFASLRALSQDAMGKEALQQSVQRVRFQNGEGQSVVLNAGTLVISASLKEGFRGRWQVPALRSAIAARL